MIIPMEKSLYSTMNEKGQITVNRHAILHQ